LPFVIELASKLIDAGQKRLIHLTLLAEFILEVSSLTNLSQRGFEGVALSLRMLDDFLQ
jgi:hypothetical protein